ncbi:protein FAM3D-like isoform 3-T3 [Discoglossus pictus]
MRSKVIILVLASLCVLLSMLYVANKLFGTGIEMKSLRDILDKPGNVSVDKPGNVSVDKPGNVSVAKKPSHNKCRNQKSCPDNYYAFKMISGVANVIGPSICFEDELLMSGVRNNIGRGLNIAVVNAASGILKKIGIFNMYNGDVNKLVKFLETIEDGSLLFVASYDDPGTKLDDKAREIFTGFGSSFAKQIGFRDSWVFLGGNGLKAKTPYEMYIKNDEKNNKYNGWPDILEMEGCVPKKME